MTTKYKTIADKIVDELHKEREFWSRSTNDNFRKFAKQLLSKGFTEKETKDFLNEIYTSVGGEFGN